MIAFLFRFFCAVNFIVYVNKKNLPDSVQLNNAGKGLPSGNDAPGLRSSSKNGCVNAYSYIHNYIFILQATNTVFLNLHQMDDNVPMAYTAKI